MPKMSKTELRRMPVPDGKGWWQTRKLATSRTPVRASYLARLADIAEEDAEKMLAEACGWGWFRLTEAGWQGQL